MAEPYRAQTNPGGSTALDGASPEVFGAAIGRGISAVGEAANRHADRMRAVRNNSENAAAALEYAKISTELDKAEIDGRENAAPGGEGHSASIGKFAEERIGAALGNIKNPKLRERYQANYEQLKGNAFGRAYAFERASHSGKMVADVGETARTLALGQANNPDGVGLDISLQTIGSVWDNLEVAAEIKEKGKRQSQREIALSYGAAMADKDPDAFLGNAAEKRTGILNVISPYLEPEDVDRLRSRGQAELARLEALNRQKASLWEATRRDEISAMGKRIADGDRSLTDQDFDAAAADATKMGDKSLLADIEDWRSLHSVSIETRDYTKADWADAVGQLEAKDPAKRTTAEALRLKHLQQLRGPAEARFDKDPHAWANNAGSPPPPIDWQNPTPAQGAARAQWSKSFQRATGSAPALLNPEEINVFRQRAESGIAGQIETAQAMREMFGVADGKLALQQIDKSNANLALMVAMPANTAKDYALGAAAIARNSKLNQKDVANEYFAELGPAVPQALRGPLWDAARAIAAAELDRAGVADPDEDDYRQAFQRGVQRAAGATGTSGGFVRWGDTPIWIPPEMDKSEALRRLSRASPVALIEAGTNLAGTAPIGAPYYMGANGKPVRYDAAAAAQLLKRGQLESVAPGLFRIVLEDGGHVVNKDGQLWQFDIRKLK